MSAVKSLASVVAVWTGLALLAMSPARGDGITQAEAQRLWTMVWSAGAINTYHAAATPAPAPPPAPAPVPVAIPSTPPPAPASVAIPAPAPVTPIIAGSNWPSIAMPATSVSVPTDAPAAITAPVSMSTLSTMAVPVSMPVSTPILSTPMPSTGQAPANVFLNMTSGPFPSATGLTTGTAQAWYNSPAAIQAFGGVPNAQQQASFVQSVLQDVQHTYQISGMDPTITTNPNTPALHTISVASGLSYGPNPSAIGITDVGGNGFSFIDKLDYANNPTDLAWAIAHNVSHEMMHAFGIGYHPDAGNYVDAASANWSSLINPNMQFGPNAIQLLLASQYGTLSGSTSVGGIGAEVLNPGGVTVEGDQTIAPEPATVAMWALGAIGGLVMYRRRASRASA